jgi:4-methyl-5(b-hydroxyethyl)-thiazole monophosphate biosynthesis
MKKALLLLARGFEETEVVFPLDILRRGGIEVDVVSISAEKMVEGGHAIRLEADKTLEECDAEAYDLVIIPGGGGGVDNLKNDSRVLELLRKYKVQGKWIAALCAGPLVLSQAGILNDVRLTSYPSVKSDLADHIKEYSEERVVIHDGIITSRGPGCAEEFGFAILEKLADRKTVSGVKEKMLSSLA